MKQIKYGLSLLQFHWVEYWKPNGFEKLIEAIELQRSRLSGESDRSRESKPANLPDKQHSYSPESEPGIRKYLYSSLSKKFILPLSALIILLFSVKDVMGPREPEDPNVPGITSIGGTPEEDVENSIITIGQERILEKSVTNQDFKDGITAFNISLKETTIKDKILKLEEAKKNLDTYLTENKGIPTALIFKNNAQALIDKYKNKSSSKVYFIAAPVPVKEETETVAENMIRGIAVAQDEFNRNNQNDQKIVIILASDKSNTDFSQKIAKELVGPDLFPELNKIDIKISGVVGHRSSISSIAAIEVYDSKNISMITPTSSSTDLKNRKYEYFFRVAPSNEDIFILLEEYVKEDGICFKNNALVLYHKDDNYSENLSIKFKNSSGNYKILEFNKIDDLDKPIEIENYFNSLMPNTGEIPNPNEDKCVILVPGVNHIGDGIKILKYFREKDDKIKFFGTSSLHVHTQLESNSSNVAGLIIEEPAPIFKTPSEETTKYYQWVTDSASWRTQTSYLATQYFTQAIQTLKSDNMTKEQRENIKDHIGESLEGDENNVKHVCLQKLDEHGKLTGDQISCSKK